ncbi:MAG TPA: SusC/RagA family TonB-linked outer membrane protein [Cyclobacteriaceae bacterium]|nr:SusC/RagA family TonB-linked outer membrane protein [Cyclobacteriaceae bacterium]
MKRFLLTSLTLLLSGAFLFAQERSVSGTVTDASTGEGIPGVNVLIQGTTSGSVTDIDGKFQLEVPSGAVTLVLSYVGYKTVTVALSPAQTTVDVGLEADVTALSEVVVVGYGTQEKKEVTSAVSSVKAENFNQGNVNNPAQLIQGKVAGLSITKPGGNPNGGYQIRVRGTSSVGQNTQPLVVIDGIAGGSLDNIDPQDIASIDVLKDGSSAAIYGTRGSTGVILVTTKTGKEGRFEVDYNGLVTVEMPARFVPMMDADGFRALSLELGISTNDAGSTTNWFEEITQTAKSHVHNLSMSGGSSKTTYRASINYRDAQGIAITTGFRQLNSSLNITQKGLKDKLTVTYNLFGTFKQADYGFDEAFRYATVYNPTAPVNLDPGATDYDRWQGYYQSIAFDYYNPVAILELNTNQGKDTRINQAIRGSYEVLENLSVDAFFSLQNESFLRGRYYDKNSYWRGVDTDGRGERELNQNFNQLFETTVRWTGDIGAANLNVLGGYSYQDFINEGFHAYGGIFITDAFGFNNLGAARQFPQGLGDIDSYKDRAKLIAFFGRVNLNVNETYFLSASVRQEGSSKFGENNKWGLFPAVSAGVELANFIGSPSIDNLKARVSWGVTGNLPRNSYASLFRLTSGSSFFYNGAFVPGYGPGSNANPDLKWEKKSEIDIGIDYSFMGSRIFGSLDYYTRTTSDLLLNFTVPVPPNLYNSTLSNIGEIKNSGIELAVAWKAVQATALSYTPSLTFNYYLENKIVSLSSGDLEFGGFRDISDMGSPGQNGTPLIRVEEGKEMGQIWGLVYEGVDETGNWVFADVNGDGIKSGGNEDRAVIGHGLPDFDLGFSNTFTFGQNWDANIFFRGSFGHDLLNSYRGFYEVPNLVTGYNVYETAGDIRSPGGVLLTTNSGKASSLHVEKGDFLRLDNFNIGYNFSLPANAAFRKIRLYLAGNNLFTISGYKGVDPEVRWIDQEIGSDDSYQMGGVLSPGLDRRNTWFVTRSVSLGVNLGF